MSSAECENGLSPVKRIRYQYTSMKSKATGYETKTGLPGNRLSQDKYSGIARSGAWGFSRQARHAAGCVCHQAAVLGSAAAPGKVSRLTVNVLTRVLSDRY